MKHPDKVQPVARAAAESVAETTGGVNESHDSAFNNNEDQDAPEVAIEYLSVSSFLRRIPYQFHMDEVARYGSKVGVMAEGLHCSYKTRIDPSLGELRVFPVRLLMRVYKIVAAEKQWPKIIEVDPLPALENCAKTKELLGSNERAERALEGLSERIDDARVLTSVETLREYLRCEAERLKQELAQATAAAVVRT